MPSIDVRNVSVSLPIYGAHNMNLKGRLAQILTGRRAEVEVIQALRNVSLSARDGDRIGITGPNGAGKTTLLRVTAGILPPTKGEVRVEGSVVSLLDASLGLDPGFTGYENVVRRGLFLNQTRQQMLDRIDEIAEFSGLGDRMRHPVHTYSSGMRARLAFSIATSIDPEILIIDEGIGTADAEFADRAAERYRNLLGRTRIVVIASHNQDYLATMCNRFIRLESSYLVSD